MKYYNNIMREFSKALKSAMEMRGCSIKRLAQLCKRTEESMAKVVAGTDYATMADLDTIGEHLNVDWLVVPMSPRRQEPTRVNPDIKVITGDNDDIPF